MCGEPLHESDPIPLERQAKIPYQDLVDMLDSMGGEIRIELRTMDIERQKERRFLVFGFGYAWEKKLLGQFKGIDVLLKSGEVIRKRRMGFPYRGYGFSWCSVYRGSLSGNEIQLAADRVTMKRTYSFPYFGYGRAWVEEMSGSCGSRIRAELKTTRVEKKREYGFPYVGYGYAWVAEAELTLCLVKDPGLQTNLSQESRIMEEGNW